MRIFLSVFTLFGLWLLMSGIYKPMIVWFGFFSSCVAVFFAYRMGVFENSATRLLLHPLRFIRYLGWLMVEIAKSNIAVTRLVLSPGPSLRQNIFRVPHVQKSELAQVIFANSITLTPGTITVETEENSFWVHAVNYDTSDHEALEDMNTRVAAIETERD